ncbi:MAG: hypothetical protein OEZ39_00585 [Gammaproteobacteria bacterium]|nr:hypothetical protein [Gammaproteobacteria bacterium]MDH5650345.1 hypothetical protein [Gammaproteobacteria bacterium]
MIRRTALIASLIAAFAFSFTTSSAFAAEGGAAPEKSACEKKADKKKISDEKKRAAFIKKCESKKKGK